MSVSESSFLYRHAGSVGACVDLTVFAVLATVGMAPVHAHVISLILSWPLYYLLHTPIRSLIRDETGWSWRKLACILVFSIILMTMRGGVIFSLQAALSAHQVLAFMPALLVTFVGNLLYERYLVRADAHASLHAALTGAVVFVILSKFLFLPALELIPEESYYWLYAVHLSPGYLDHPPMVGWLIWMGTSLFGINEFGVRFFAPLCMVGAATTLVLLYRRLFGPKGSYICFVLALSLPYLNGAGFFISPDAPLAFFWSVALLVLHRALTGASRYEWLVFGVVIGLGMLSKYSIVLLGLPALALILLVPEFRGWLKKPLPYAGAFVALLVFMPVLYWNATHEWASFVFQGPRRFQSALAFSTHQLLLDMVCLVTPAVFFSAWYLLFTRGRIAFGRGKDQGGKAKGELFLLACFILPASVFILYSLRHVPKLNWTGPSYLAMVPLVSWWLVHHSQNLSRTALFIRGSFLPVMLGWFALLGFAMHYLGLGLPFVPYSERMHRVIGWRALSEATVEIVHRVEVQTGVRPVVVGMDKHNIAAQQWFYLTKRMGGEGRPLVGSRNIVGDEGLMFRFWSPPQPFVGKPMVLIARSERDINDERLHPFFESLGPVEPLELYTGGWRTRTYFYRVAFGYKGYSEEEITMRAPDLLPEQQPQFTPAPPDLTRS